MVIFKVFIVGLLFCCSNALLSNHSNKILFYYIIIIGYTQQVLLLFTEIYSERGPFQSHISIKINGFVRIILFGQLKSALGCSFGLADRTYQTNLVGLAGMVII
jgi:cytochrome c biogenesis factor